MWIMLPKSVREGKEHDTAYGDGSTFELPHFSIEDFAKLASLRFELLVTVEYVLTWYIN